MPKYDVAIIGAGISGLAAGVLLARAGRRVLVVDPDDTPGGILAPHQQDQVRFASGPVITRGFEPGGPLRALHAAIGLPIAPHSSSLSYQVVLPDHRITIFSDHAATLEEFRREYPGEIDQIGRLFRDLQTMTEKSARSRIYAALQRRRRAGRFLDAYRFSPGLKACLNMQSLFFFGQQADSITLADLATLVVAPPTLLPRGFHGLAVQLRDAMTAVGGEFRASGSWPELQVREKRIVPFTLVHDHQVESRSVVLNTAWGGERTLYLAVREDVLPVSMSSTVICLPDYAAPDDVCFLTLHQEDDAAATLPGLKALTVTFMLPGRREPLRASMLDRVRTVIPFLDGFIVSSVEQDLMRRRVPAYQQFEQTAKTSSSSAMLKTGRAARHLYLLQDRPYALGRSIEAARSLAAALD